MLTLQEVKEKTEKVFDDGLKSPESFISMTDRLKALKKCGLTRHVARGAYELRLEQTKSMGFVQLSQETMVEMLMGEPHNSYKVGKVRSNYEWVYNHHTDEFLTRWGGSSLDYFLRRGRFFKKEVWRCRFGKLDYLKITLPYGVVLRINELKERKLFNVFNVLAPIDAWIEEPKAHIDPIVVGSIWELPIDHDGGQSKAGRKEHFFIAQW